MNSRNGLARQISRGTLAWVLVAALVAPLLAASSATAMDDLSKQEWQADYRNLLREKARAERNVESARVNYMRANRRNYPRGAARHQFVLDGEEAKKELAKIEAEVTQLLEDGRQAGALSSWFADVEDEGITAEPAARADDADDVDDREGRNPLYADDE